MRSWRYLTSDEIAGFTAQDYATKTKLQTAALLNVMKGIE